MNLLYCIYHLGLKNGLKYWQINRHYSKKPEELPYLISAMRFKAVLEPEMPWADIADKFQQSLDSWKKKRNIKS